MKQGMYKVSFMVEINDCKHEYEAIAIVEKLVSDALDEEKFPEIELELVEEFDLEYHTEEDDVEELDFS